MNHITRTARTSAGAAASSQQWACFFCQKTLPPTSPVSLARRSFVPAAKRSFSSSISRRAQPQPTARPSRPPPRGPTTQDVRNQQHKNNVSLLYYALSISIGAVALAYSAVPLYKMVCQTIGWGGQPVRAHQPGDEGSDISSRLVPVTDANRIRVTFNASVSDTLPWKFVPQQREVSVLPGETALAFYKATNLGDKDIIGVATYSVTPGQCAPYFSKIQCFCFEEQRLNAGETVDMPVFFYLDPDLLNDINMRGVETVTLNYTFFKARYDNNGRFQRPMSS